MQNNARQVKVGTIAVVKNLDPSTVSKFCPGQPNTVFGND